MAWIIGLVDNWIVGVLEYWIDEWLVPNNPLIQKSTNPGIQLSKGSWDG